VGLLSLLSLLSLLRRVRDEETIALDVTGQSTANGTPVEVWDCNGGGNQAWTRS
jgi:hypothetical protein